MGGDPWGGSEELWTRAAKLLVTQGVPVAASVQDWPQRAPKIVELVRAGVDVRFRPFNPSSLWRARRHLSGKSAIAFDVTHAFGSITPALVVISTGYFMPYIELVEMCVAKGWPFVTLAHSNSTSWWISDEHAARFRSVLPLARRCYFVSEASRILAERQLDYNFVDAEIARNPLLVDKNAAFPWPDDTTSLHMACVGRLDIATKGLDILLDALAKPCWRSRDWQLTLYGEGQNRYILKRLIARLELEHRVFIAGHLPIEQIWSQNHILIVPSRFEGGPMITIEAMWCGRPVVATPVGLNPEVIEDDATGFLADGVSVNALAKALERMWERRNHLREIGTLAAASIRKWLPDDPVGTFAEKIRSLAARENA